MIPSGPIGERRPGSRRPSMRRAGTLSVVVVALIVLGVLVARNPSWLRFGKSSGQRCGWIARGDTVLDRDVVDCERNGIRLASGAVLDCAGHEIRGLGADESDSGVALEDASGSEVRNCKISGFERGIRIRGGSSNRILSNRLEKNGYGVDVAGQTDAGRSEGHQIFDNEVRDSLRDGIHIGAGSVRISVSRNVITESGEEGIYLQACDECSLIGNTIEKSASAALDVKDSSNGFYADNVMRGALVKLRGASAHNLFARNELIDSGFVLGGAGDEDDESRVPHDNEFVGGAVGGRPVCFRFTGAYDNHVRGVLIRDCKAAQERPYGKRAASGNTLKLRESTGDFDADGTADAADRCTDLDGDGIGDPGFPAAECGHDNCPDVKNPAQEDGDQDGVGDACDVCPQTADPGQRDRDADGVGDACK